MKKGLHCIVEISSPPPPPSQKKGRRKEEEQHNQSNNKITKRIPHVLVVDDLHQEA